MPPINPPSPADPHAIAGTDTAIAAFIGNALTGPVDAPVRVRSFSEFENQFGGLSADGTLGYAVSHFFLAGGGDALIVRVGGTGPISDGDISAAALASQQRGLWALDKSELFNLLCIPPLTRNPGGDIGAATRVAADEYCRNRRAFYIADPLMSWSKAAEVNLADFGLAESANAALYFPRIRAADPLQANALQPFAPCGAVAGIFARTDATRGVWKAPAGIHATLTGVATLDMSLSQADSAALSAIGVNGLRNLPGIGNVVWGARTLGASDNTESEWKYVSVRRLLFFIEESISGGLQWVLFEPNDALLWSQIRLEVDAFMHDLFNRGAFQGATPAQAYYVKCGPDTMNQDDIQAGRIKLEVGFAPVRPDEFVVVSVTTLSGA